MANHIVLDQIQCFHYRQVRMRTSAVSPQALKAALAALRQMFEE